MPIINVAMGPMEENKKKELIQNLTDTAVKTTGITKEHFTVLIQEMALTNIGVGGNTLKEIMANK
ncbi:MAG: tautomerase family protein [Spirochaetaceae bacterium]|jgi:4-oxalocrotonate tautomerase family enzyme|nr:tautomerase family protein [Spirochaetaceae bacterium]